MAIYKGGTKISKIFIGDKEITKIYKGTQLVYGDEPELPPAVVCSELLTMYKGDTTLTETPIINATGCTSLYEVFRGCTNLRTVNYIHMPNVTNTSRTFHSCSSLTSVPELNMSNVTNAGSMFYGCSSLTSVPELDTSSMTSASAMFSGCSSLTSVPELNMSNVTNVNSTASMFYNCSSLTSVTFTGNRVPPYGYRMFNGTPIASGNGYIFVPDNMVTAYKVKSGWSAHASVIRGISEKGALQSNISMCNMQIKENPTMFAMTEEEELVMMRELEEELEK